MNVICVRSCLRACARVCIGVAVTVCVWGDPGGGKPWDGWMICDFTSYSTVFQSYQDDGRMIMKGCKQWNPVYG